MGVGCGWSLWELWRWHSIVIYSPRIELDILVEVTMIKKTFKVEDMHCANCAMKIESIEDDLSGIKEVNASYVKQQMIVEYDENAVSVDEIITAVKKRGYKTMLA